MYWHHVECRGSFAELHSDNHACKLRVCCPVKAGKYGQLKNGRGHRCIRSTAPLRNQYPERMGLMKCGNVVIPFDNQIEKGTDLYNLYNTNIREKIALEKSKNAVDIG